MRTPIALSLAAIMLGSALSAAADAATVLKVASRNPAGACVLSIPTTNTGVRPKATGFRNEGNVSNFVICNVDIDTSGEGFTNIYIGLLAFDGASHTFDCTAMDRFASAPAGDYSTKSVTANNWGELFFYPDDFPTTHLEGWNASITCQLPPGVSVFYVGGYHNDNIGA